MKKMVLSAFVVALSIAFSPLLGLRTKNVEATPPGLIAYIRDTILETANAKLGCKYSYGADGPNKFDCGGLTRYCCKQANYTLKGDSAASNCEFLFRIGRADDHTSTSYDTLYPSDLIYYALKGDNGRYKYISHVSIFDGYSNIIDASSSKGKVVKRSRTTFTEIEEVAYGKLTRI